MANDLTDKIERLEVFEERAGVRLEALYARFSGTVNGEQGINVNGEVHTRQGTALVKDLTIVIDAYDSSGRLVAEDPYSSIRREDFFGFETFSRHFGVPSKEISKIRVYPKLS